ncbi:MAG: hypothetical protein AVDCRST_MAG65-2069 [uncultured Solirubrobacteraceae bacterium]|uniref:Uncharacterized protein n=1 Tax=uncultured Solirubrobacteraceae bacterium TaxID=1162706 RepID=A0A6J4SEE9_9ACTN|nr:MAG: hypothetical protein AVDCRST_MAG65-2069 [uncultured Solirubrobacteraceae bacterium]
MVGRERDEVLRAEAADRSGMRVAAAGDGADDQVAVGDDAARATLLDHEDGADIAVAHGLSHVDQIGGGLDRPRVVGHQLADRLGHGGSSRRVCDPRSRAQQRANAKFLPVRTSTRRST